VAVSQCPRCGAPAGPRDRYCGSCATDLTLAAGADSLLGALVAERYRLLESMGSGNFGRVFRGEHVRMGKPVAVKVLRADLSRNWSLVRRFYRETQEVSRLQNPHTVTVFDFGVDDPSGCIYVTMELLKGIDLGTLLLEVERLSVGRAARILAQACVSVAEAHRLDILHLGLKPENLFLSRTREGDDFVKVLDYGLARLQEPEAAQSEAVHLVGSPDYVAPEQIRGVAGPQADIYALGGIFYRMVTGRPPFRARSPLGVLQAHLTDPVPDPRESFAELELHEEVSAVLRRALAKDPEQRQRSAESLRADFLALAEMAKAERPASVSSPPRSGSPADSGPRVPVPAQGPAQGPAPAPVAAPTADLAPPPASPPSPAPSGPAGGPVQGRGRALLRWIPLGLLLCAVGLFLAWWMWRAST